MDTHENPAIKDTEFEEILDNPAITPKNLEDLVFHVIQITAPGISPRNWAIMLTGLTEKGENGIWMDNYCVYDENNPKVVATLESMVGKTTKFWDAESFITNEWVTEEDTWAEMKPVYP